MASFLTIDSLTMITRVLSFSSDQERTRVSGIGKEGVSLKSISPVEFVKRKSEGWNPFLLDVRSESEESITSLEGTDRESHIHLFQEDMEKFPLIEMSWYTAEPEVGRARL